MNVHFAQPFWILAGILTCGIALAYLRRSALKRRQAIARFAGSRICGRLTANVSISRRRIKDICFLCGLFCCFLALARPQYGEEWIEVKQKGIDLLIALDVSKSMGAQDIKPDRLQRAKLAIKDFVTTLEGDRIGLMPFAGSSFLMCPLTTDYEAFTTSLNAVDTTSIPLGGTNIASVIDSANTILSNAANHRILILVTDGENLNGDTVKAAVHAAKNNMTIYTVGVGTQKGELIPDQQHPGTFLKDDSDNFIRSQLDESTLTTIAEKTDGVYVPLGNMGQGFTTIYEQKLNRIPKEEHREQKQRRPIERFSWPLASALLFLMIEFLLSGRKASGSFRIPFIKTAGRRIFNHKKLLIVFLCLCTHPSFANGSTADQLYRDGKLDEARKEYTASLEKKPNDPVLRFNLGDVYYKKKEFDKAASSFTEALATEDLNLQAKSYYNLGNVRYQQGKTSLQTDLEGSIDLYQKALAAYESCLALTPEDSDAVFNRNLVKNQLESLKKQQQKHDKKEQKQQQDNSGQQNGPQNKKETKQSPKENQQHQKEETQPKSTPSSEKNDTGQAQEKSEQDKTKNQQEKNTSTSAPLKNKEQQEKMQGKIGNIQKQSPDDNQAGSAMSQADQDRRQQGKMTTLEAKRLLEALKNEEGRLEFIPQDNENQREPAKNW